MLEVGDGPAGLGGHERASVTDLETEGHLELDTLRVERIVTTVVGREAPKPGDDPEPPKAESSNAAAKLSDGLHRTGEIDSGQAPEPAGVLPNERGHFVVVDERALRPPPGGQETDGDVSLVHGRDRRGERDLRDGILAGPAAQRLEDRLLLETARRVLHPHIDDRHGMDSLRCRTETLGRHR